jgi:hypothetical protein
MIRSFFVALAILALSPVAHATSIRDVRLLYKQVPAVSPIGANTLVSIVIYGDGEAVRFDCDAHTPRACSTRTLKKYTAHQIDALDHLIDEARHGKVTRAPSTARCIVAPSTTDEYTADNGSVLLYKGHICTSAVLNRSPAAAKLIQVLRNLRGDRS